MNTTLNQQKNVNVQNEENLGIKNQNPVPSKAQSDKTDAMEERFVLSPKDEAYLTKSMARLKKINHNCVYTDRAIVEWDKILKLAKAGGTVKQANVHFTIAEYWLGIKEMTDTFAKEEREAKTQSAKAIKGRG